MSVMLGKRSNGEVGLFVAPDGTNARTCAKSQLDYEIGNQAQVYKNGSHIFTGSDVYQTKYYRKKIYFADQGIKPIVSVQPIRNSGSSTYINGDFRADNVTTYLDASFVSSSTNPAAVTAAQNLGCVFKFKVTNTSLEVTCSKNTNIGFGYMILNRAYNEPNISTGQVAKLRIDEGDRRLLISRPGQSVDLNSVEKCWFNSDLPNLRKWGVVVSTINPAVNHTWNFAPNQGITMHQKVLCMFKPPSGRVYNIGSKSFTSQGFLMAFSSALYIYSYIGGQYFGNGSLLKGVEIEEYRATDELRIRSFESSPIVVGMFVFHNDLG